ncbi:MAG: hypothetical protein WCT04_13385 [Planctomycetota bacterium]
MLDWNSWLPRVHPKDAFPVELALTNPARDGTLLQRSAWFLQRSLVLYNNDLEIKFNEHVSSLHSLKESDTCRAGLAKAPSLFVSGMFV